MQIIRDLQLLITLYWSFFHLQAKLEQLEEEEKSGKELHDDQKKAIKRYDQVNEMLDIFKEFHKNMTTLLAEVSLAWNF